MIARKTSRHSRTAPVISIIAFLIVAGFCAFLLWKHMHQTKPLAITASEETKGEPKSTNDQPSKQQPNTPSNSGSGSSSTDTVLVASTGNFVSNHHPNLSGSPSPNQMTSTCTTTPGAICQISFTQGSTTKSLPSETTDAGGSAYWNWKLQDIGITTGSWQVQATVQLNGETKVTTDVLALEVSP